MEKNEARKRVVNGKLAEFFFTIPLKIETVDMEIKEIRQRVTGTKSISYDKQQSSGGISNDEKLANMIVKIQKLEKKKSMLHKQQNKIKKDLCFSELTDTERKTLEAVYSTSNYEQAGKKLGYSKIQVYRIMSSVYQKLGRSL